VIKFKKIQKEIKELWKKIKGNCLTFDAFGEWLEH
jgi:hypothetical protein